MRLVQKIHVEDVRVLVDGPEEDLHLHQVHDHPVSREHVTHEVLKHDERLHEEVLRVGEEEEEEELNINCTLALLRNGSLHVNPLRRSNLMRIYMKKL